MEKEKEHSVFRPIPKFRKFKSTIYKIGSSYHLYIPKWVIRKHNLKQGDLVSYEIWLFEIRDTSMVIERDYSEYPWRRKIPLCTYVDMPLKKYGKNYFLLLMKLDADYWGVGARDFALVNFTKIKHVNDEVKKDESNTPVPITNPA